MKSLRASEMKKENRRKYKDKEEAERKKRKGKMNREIGFGLSRSSRVAPPRTNAYNKNLWRGQNTQTESVQRSSSVGCRLIFQNKREKRYNSRQSAALADLNGSTEWTQTPLAITGSTISFCWLLPFCLQESLSDVSGKIYLENWKLWCKQGPDRRSSNIRRLIHLATSLRLT